MNTAPQAGGRLAPPRCYRFNLSARHGVPDRLGKLGFLADHPEFLTKVAMVRML